MTLRRIATLAAAVPLLLALDRDAGACSVCLAGDPFFSRHGTTAQEAGRVSLYIEALGFRKESGLLPHEQPEHEEHGDHEGEEHADQEHEGEERSSGQRIDAYLAWTPIDRLTLTLNVPWAFHEIEEHEGGETTRSTLSGLGDVSLAASGVLWRNRDVLPTTWIEGRLFLKTPTGPSDRKVDGVRDPHLQTGTGSWDFGAGLAVLHRLAWGSLYGSAFYRENTEGDLDYEYGDVILANAGLEVPVGHAFPSTGLDWLTLGLEMNFRYAEYDRANGERFQDSGGAILYATPVVRIRLPFGVGERPVSLRLAVQLPLVQTWLHNSQREREVWSAGVLIPF